MTSATASPAENHAAPLPPRRFGTGTWVALAAAVAAVAVAVLRRDGSPLAGWLAAHLTLIDLQPAVRDHAVQILTVPLGSIVVVVFRLTLGLGMLGPFRPILIALAMQWTGALVGAVFLASVMTLIVLLRPPLRRGMMPYYGRLSILLAVVVLVQVSVLLVGAGHQLPALERAAFFPIVVLTLTADGFARALAQDGFRSAVFRGAVTLLIALLVHRIVHLEGTRELLLGHPEVILLSIAAIFLIANHLGFGLLRRLNPQSAARPSAEGAPAPAGADAESNGPTPDSKEPAP